jgi:hypothetical protein
VTPSTSIATPTEQIQEDIVSLMTAVSEQLKLDVTIPAEGGIELGAWLFLPEGDGIRDHTVPAAYRSPDAIDFYLQPVPEGLWKNEVTLRSTRAARMYEPGIWVSRVSPTPLLMIVARDDKLTIADLALAAYERACDTCQPIG